MPIQVPRAGAEKIMSILRLSAKAQAFYEASRGRSLYSGYEKNVLVRDDSENCLFVDASYIPQPGDTIFRCRTINQNTAIDLKTQVPADASTFALKGKFTTKEWIAMLRATRGIMRTPELDPKELLGKLTNVELKEKIEALTLGESEALLGEIERFWQNDIHFTVFLSKVL